MANSYAALGALKGASALNITGAGEDARLLALLEGVSRLIDRLCNRHFYVLNAARVFDGGGGARLLLPDLVSVDAGGVTTDEDGDRIFETAWADNDYALLPPNADPTSGGAHSRPYTSIEAIRGNGVWPAGRRTVRIAGQWGWHRRLRRAAETLAANASPTEGGLSLSASMDVDAGHTLLVDSEQIYVRGRDGNALAVDRGVNGTAASSHSNGATIYVYEYPEPIVEAALLQAARLRQRGGGQAEAGPHGGLGGDARLMLGAYRKAALGVGV